MSDTTTYDEAFQVLLRSLHNDSFAGYATDNSDPDTDNESIDTRSEKSVDHLTLDKVYQSLYERVESIEEAKIRKSVKPSSVQRHRYNIEQLHETQCSLDDIKILRLYLEAISSGSSPSFAEIKSMLQADTADTDKLKVKNEWFQQKQAVARLFYQDLQQQMQANSAVTQTAYTTKLGIAKELENHQQFLQEEIDARVKALTLSSDSIQENAKLIRCIDDYENIIEGKGVLLQSYAQALQVPMNSEQDFIRRNQNDTQSSEFISMAIQNRDENQRISDDQQQRQLVARLDLHGDKPRYFLGAYDVPQSGQSTDCLPFYDVDNQKLEVVLVEKFSSFDDELPENSKQSSKIVPWMGESLEKMIDDGSSAPILQDHNFLMTYEKIITGHINENGQVNGDFKLDNVLYDTVTEACHVIDNKFNPYELPAMFTTGLLSSGMLYDQFCDRAAKSIDNLSPGYKSTALFERALIREIDTMAQHHPVGEDVFKYSLNEALMLQRVFYGPSETQHDVFAMASLGIELVESLGEDRHAIAVAFKNWCVLQQRAMILSMCEKVIAHPDVSGLNSKQKNTITNALSIDPKTGLLDETRLQNQKDRLITWCLDDDDDNKSGQAVDTDEVISSASQTNSADTALDKDHTATSKGNKPSFFYAVFRYFNGINRAITSFIGRIFRRSDNIDSQNSPTVNLALEQKKELMSARIDQYVTHVKAMQTVLHAMNDEFTVDGFRKKFNDFQHLTLDSKIDDMIDDENNFHHSHQASLSPHTLPISKAFKVVTDVSEQRLEALHRDSIDEDPLTPRSDTGQSKNMEKK